MANIASGNVEIYIRQLLSEEIGNDEGSQNPALDENFIDDEYLKLIEKSVSDKSKANR